MGKPLRAIAAIAVAGFEIVVVLAAAGIGGVLGYNAPARLAAAGVDGWPGNTTSISPGFYAGLLGLALASGVGEILNSVMPPLRALTRTPLPSPAYGVGAQAADEDLPTNAADLIVRLTEAAQAGGAHQAAMHSAKVDPARNLLHQIKLWIGIDGTSALFPLTHGAYVQYDKNEDGTFAVPEYTFVVPGTHYEPVPVTSMDQVRDLLEQHLDREVDDVSASA